MCGKMLYINWQEKLRWLKQHMREKGAKDSMLG
jgi:hypothetical protein